MCVTMTYLLRSFSCGGGVIVDGGGGSDVVVFVVVFPFGVVSALSRAERQNRQTHHTAP